MAVLERAKDLITPKGNPVPRTVQDKIQRGRTERNKGRPARRLCMKFWEGDQYWYVNEKGILNFQDTVTHASGAGKPRHRIRNTYNFIKPIVEAKVSAATQKVPGYEVVPSTNDPDDLGAARLAEQVAWYGYDKWALRRATIKAVTLALVVDEGFAMPYFDTNIGPFVIDPDTEEVIGQGEIKVLTLSADQVYWEPGVDFEDSRWHVIERAVPVDEVENIPGFNGVVIKPDATTEDLPTDGPTEQMVLLTEYLERPSPKFTKGRRIRIANDRVICPEEDYPCANEKGQVLDEPVIHRISWTVHPESDHDGGLVSQLIDLQRTINDCWNKLLEFKNRGLVPQMIAPRGSNVTPRTDEPGAINYYNPVGGQAPTWEQPVRVPQELFQMLEQSISHLRALAADTDVQAEADLAAKTVNAVIEQAAQRWQSFLGDLAEFHSRLMRHCLYLVARHYSEPRQIEIRGQYDWAPLESFTGQDLRSQVNIRVTPGSILAKTRQQVMQEVQFLQTNWPNAIGPETAIAILHGGNADELLKSPQYDIARAARMVRLLERGMPALEAEFQPIMRVMTVGPLLGTSPEGKPIYGSPGAPDAMGVPVSQEVMMEHPGWMPREQDNIAIYKQVFGDAMKTPKYDKLPPEIQEGYNLFWGGLEMAERERAMKKAQLEVSMASDLGMKNAAKPQGDVQQPSLPGLESPVGPPQ